MNYLRYLNPEFRTNMTPPEPYNVRVPKNKGNDVVAVFRRMNNNRNVAAVTNGVGGETWETLSNRTGVSVADLKAANPGMGNPQGRVIVPSGNKVQSTTYQRPTTPTQTQTTTTVTTVKAKSGDTVAKLAARYGVSAVDVANQNGFTSINTPLQAGREVKIPTK